MMRILAGTALISIVAGSPTAGQQVQQQGKTIAFPAFTTDQNWTRATTLIYSYGVGGFAFAKSRGASAEEFGRGLGETFAPGWGTRDAGSAIRYARAIQNNLRALTGAVVDVLSVSDTMIMMRTTRPWVSYFGPSKQINGVTLSEYETVNRSFHESIAQYLGLRYEERADSAYITMTISGRGKNAVIAFPRATYAVAFTAQEAGAATWLAGSWEATYESNGKYTLRHDGQPFVAADYELSFDELVFKNETTPTGVGCSAPGRYRWTVNPANGNLSLGRIADDCANRVLFLTRRALSKKG